MKALFHYYLSFIKALTFRRWANLLRLFATYFISRIRHKVFSPTFPYFISVEPTTSCNLKCPECPSGLRRFSRPTGMLNDETMKNIVNQLAEYLLYVTFYFQGEPFLHPNFGRYVRMLRQKKIVVGTSTNAHFLTAEKGKEIIESGLNRLIVSIDGTDAQTYATYRRGGNFDTVLKNVEGFIKLRKSMKSNLPMVELQFIVFKHNEHQIDGIKEIGKTLGVDKVVIKTAQLYEFEQGNPLMPGKIEYSRYQLDKDGKYRIKGGIPNYCQRSWNGSVITWDGDVVPCCFDKDADHRFGNINRIAYSEILNSEDYITFRQQILTDRKQIEICRNCTEGL